MLMKLWRSSGRYNAQYYCQCCYLFLIYFMLAQLLPLVGNTDDAAWVIFSFLYPMSLSFVTFK